MPGRSFYEGVAGFMAKSSETFLFAAQEQALINTLPFMQMILKEKDVDIMPLDNYDLSITDVSKSQTEI